jgi:hypothetical protein
MQRPQMTLVQRGNVAHNRGMNLCDVFPTLTMEERMRIAQHAGIGEAYLRELAKHRFCNPTLERLVLISEAHPKLKLHHLVDEFAPLCKRG